MWGSFTKVEREKWMLRQAVRSHWHTDLNIVLLIKCLGQTLIANKLE